MFKLIRVSLIISLSFFLFSSCSNQRILGENVDFEETNYTTPYFNTNQKEYLYSASIKAFGNNIKGILAVKKLGEDHKRLALLSDFGNTLLDFEFIQGKVKINYVMDDLNKKIILNKLKKYLHLLIHSDYEVKKMFKSEEQRVIQSRFQGKQLFLFIDNSNRLTQLKQASKFKDKVDIYFYGASEEADSISFISHELPIRIDLKKRN